MTYQKHNFGKYTIYRQGSSGLLWDLYETIVVQRSHTCICMGLGKVRMVVEKVVLFS